jgi:hypothetical protein
MLPSTAKERGFVLIDRNNVIDALHQKFGDRYHIIPEALWEAAGLWGVTPESGSINDCGVFTDTTDSFHLVAGGCTGEARLTQAPNGEWVMSTYYSTRISGSGYACSVWSQIAFPTREDARLAAVYELIARFQDEASNRSSCSSEAHQREAQQMSRLLEAEKMPQLALF